MTEPKVGLHVENDFYNKHPIISNFYTITPNGSFFYEDSVEKYKNVNNNGHKTTCSKK